MQDDVAHPSSKGLKRPAPIARAGRFCFNLIMAQPNPMLAGLTCPKCNCPCDGASLPDGSKTTPRPGDVTTCSHCLAVLQFTVLGLAFAPEHVLIEIAGDEEFKAANAAAAHLKRVRPKFGFS